MYFLTFYYFFIYQNPKSLCFSHSLQNSFIHAYLLPQKPIHLPPKEEGVFLEILDKQLFSYILLPTLPTDIRDVVTRLFWQ